MIDTPPGGPIASVQVKMRRLGRSFLGKSLGFLCAAAALAPLAARADEPKNAGEPRIMMESGDVTAVPDAFDGSDVFDAHISLGFQFAAKSARILRETSVAGPGLSSGGYTSHLMNVAQYTSQIARLTTRA